VTLTLKQVIHVSLLKNHQSFSNVEFVDLYFVIHKSQSAAEKTPVVLALQRLLKEMAHCAPFLDARLTMSRDSVIAH
jgi:hypothetical protein